MRLRHSLILVFLCGVAAAVLNAASKQQDKGEFLFPTNAPPQNQNKYYGKQAIEDKLFKNAIRYFTLYLQEVTTFSERAEATSDLAKAYLLNGEPTQALQVVNGFLAKTEDAPLDPMTRNSLRLTAAQANIELKEYATALNFLEPLLNMPENELGDLQAEALVAAADAWNATGQWNETQKRLASAQKNFSNTPQACANLTWRLLQASIAQKQWEDARGFIVELQGMGLTDDENTSIKLSTILCDIGEGKLEDALTAYRGMTLDPKMPPSLKKQWWDVLSTMGTACLEKNLLQDAAELFGAARQVALTQKDAYQVARSQVQALTGILTPPDAKKKAYEEAEKILSDLPDEERSDTKTTMRLAEIRRDLGKRKSASELFLKIGNNETIAKDTRYNAYVQAALCFSHEQMRADAERAFRQAETLTDSPEDKSNVLIQAAQQAAGYAPDAAAALYIEVADRFGETIATARNARLEAGRILASIGKKQEAIEQFRKFISSVPEEDSLRWEAMISMANATADDTQAANELLVVARSCPDKKMSCDAFMDAHSRALKIEKDGLLFAQQILDEFLKKHPDADSEQIRLVRLKNIILGFLLGNSATPEWGTQFINDYANSTEAPEVALRIGDWYADQTEYEKAIEFYRKVATFAFAEPKLKRMALYEEAACSNKCPTIRFSETVTDSDGNKTETERSESGQARALKLLQQIQELTPVADEILVQVKFLEGDILTSQGKTDDAIDAYRKAENMSKNDIIKCSLLGRMAELYFSQDKIGETNKCLDEIYHKDFAGDKGIEARTRLCRARCCVKQKQYDEAIYNYNEIMTEYETAQRNTPQETLSKNVFINAADELFNLFKSQNKMTLAGNVRKRYETYNKDNTLPQFRAEKSDNASPKH